MMRALATARRTVTDSEVGAVLEMAVVRKLLKRSCGSLGVR
jgi:hypothetical protein